MDKLAPGDYGGLWKKEAWKFTVFLAHWLGDVARTALIFLGMYLLLFLARLSVVLGLDPFFIEMFERADGWINYATYLLLGFSSILRVVAMVFRD